MLQGIILVIKLAKEKYGYKNTINDLDVFKSTHNFYKLLVFIFNT